MRRSVIIVSVSCLNKLIILLLTNNEPMMLRLTKSICQPPVQAFLGFYNMGFLRKTRIMAVLASLHNIHFIVREAALSITNFLAREKRKLPEISFSL